MAALSLKNSFSDGPKRVQKMYKLPSKVKEVPKRVSVSLADEDNIGPDKLIELKAAFATFDDNGDGTITSAEFQCALFRMNIYISSEEMQRMIRDVDVDGNDSLDFTEFLGLMGKIDPRFGQDVEINKAFKLFDKDQDGFITRCELVDAMRRFGVDINRDDIDMIMETTDDNDDQLISHKEFREMLFDAMAPATVPFGAEEPQTDYSFKPDFKIRRR